MNDTDQYQFIQVKGDKISDINKIPDTLPKRCEHMCSGRLGICTFNIQVMQPRKCTFSY